MPDFCAAYGCSNRLSLKTRDHGITFHRFPKTGEMRRQWELALRRDGFVAADRTLLCTHLQRLVATRSTTTSRGAEDNLPVDLSQDGPQPHVVNICMCIHHQLRWFGHLVRMPPGRTSSWEETTGRPRTRW
ncbi:hypothetical protein DPEC_G00042010 [Dallia pectoralis]|uniref:Uncharacterized protein n=1 Tax=Dallia pectoralis TaxID=75939 RepID=A0ACC2H8R0_DALPE|nr:hypothetical protein DPEC_G00042010 [Dallia pectoralis]